eukprot:NODE_3215_length_376_cov_4.003058_g3133_i0.p3 GENE.NODE_3215_length_376_cov_4.003058_g3133_i0~~NODE_3215_length_376_cov_4.003058_g3133_i0.p3  ORF type:complete len:51 (+),score=2.37 NODE_3215_length_376_cov_4.003058_g3133_i0:122-274(+)
MPFKQMIPQQHKTHAGCTNGLHTSVRAHHGPPPQHTHVHTYTYTYTTRTQ